MKKVVLGPTPFEYDQLCYFLPKNGLFRGPNGQTSYPKDKNRDEIRIICTGDSTTYGLAVSYDKSYPYLLERLLRKRFPQKNIRVLNAGYPGASERQIKRIFQFHLVKYHPDIVIFRKELFRLSDSYDVPKESNIIRHFLWRFLYESRIFRAISVVTQRWCDGYPLIDRTFDFIMYKFSGIGKDLQNAFVCDFNVIKKIAAEHNIRYVAAVDYIRVINKGKIISDCHQYLDLNLNPVICTYESFEKKLGTVAVGEIFVDIEHFTEIGTSILFQEVGRFLLAEKWIESIGDEPVQQSINHKLGNAAN